LIVAALRGAKPIILWLVSLPPAQVNLVNSEVADHAAGYPTLPGTRLASVSLTTANASPWATSSRTQSGLEGRVAADSGRLEDSRPLATQNQHKSGFGRRATRG